MSKRILVVEGRPDNRQIIRDMLAPTDYGITEAEDGEQALEAIAKQRLCTIGLEGRRDYAAIGTVSNVARRGFAMKPNPARS